MGREAIAKGASVLLGPTVNMQRTPLGGRGFESFSEDPFLAGSIAAASVDGIQSTGVAAAIKHFVCNDQEDRRMASNSIVTERTLRELYLLPFQLAQRDAKPVCYMTSYNRLNGTHCSENERLLQNILRDEWKFDGLVMSDWLGTYSTTEAIRAGLDLEMPGPSLIRGPLIKQAIQCGKLQHQNIDARVREVLKLVKHAKQLRIPENAPEQGLDNAETSGVLRRVAADSIVLLKNESDVLPLDKTKTTAVIGPNAFSAAYSGGGSASLAPYYAISPLQGIQSQAENVQYALGAPGWKRLPLLTEVSKSPDGEQGLRLDVFLQSPDREDRKPIDSFLTKTSNVTLYDYKHKLVTSDLYWAKLTGSITPDTTAEYEFSCSCAGTAKVYVNEELVVDNWTKQEAGDSFFGMGTVEVIGRINLDAGKSYDIRVEFGTLPTKKYEKTGTTDFGSGGLRIGFHRKVELKAEIEAAAALARSVDQVVLCVGLNSDWESEGYDRPHMDLPEGSDELVNAILEANPNTAIIVQSGTPVTMPWAGKAKAIAQAWYGGNETGNAIGDVVFGVVNPSAKLPLSFPARLEDTPTHHMIPDEINVLYGENVYMGYRYYEKVSKAVAFPFGHGLSYTQFEMSDFKVEQDDNDVTISVSVRNTGKRDGAEVVQVYVQALDSSVDRPVKELRGYDKIHLEAGESQIAHVKVPLKYATSFWDDSLNKWACEKGRYRVLVGNSSANTPLKAQFELRRTTHWLGI